MRILMVCLGNICRSPLAEGILREKAAGTPIEVDSAGTSAFHAGDPPDVRMIRTARKKGLDISKQKSRPFTVEDFDRFDVIYVMDNSNLDNVLKLARSEEDRKKVKRILDELDHKAEAEVPDPYFGGDAGFLHVYELLDAACDLIIKKFENGTTN